MAGKGGPVPGAGRKPGKVNEATRTIRELARTHAPKALQELARLAQEAESEAARVTAIKEILDRAYGKSPQPMSGEGGEGDAIIRVITGVSRPSDGC